VYEREVEQEDHDENNESHKYLDRGFSFLAWRGCQRVAVIVPVSPVLGISAVVPVATVVSWAPIVSGVPATVISPVVIPVVPAIVIRFRGSVVSPVVAPIGTGIIISIVSFISPVVVGIIVRTQNITFI
jgi:hypothetical protein